MLHTRSAAPPFLKLIRDQFNQIRHYHQSSQLPPSLAPRDPSQAALIINIPSKSNIYRFGDPNTSKPVLRDVEWRVQEHEAWAVVGSGSGEKTALFQTLLGHLRISPSPPPPGGLFPFLFPTNESRGDPYTAVSLVSFGNRPRSSGGAFHDFSAKYGAVREEDRVTLRQLLMLPTESTNGNETLMGEMERKKTLEFESLIERVGLAEMLDLPFVALSNGQVRRARIVRAILRNPELLLLDEPLTGLDAQNRPTLLELLRTLHASRAPRVILGLRAQDQIPEWVTHVAVVERGNVVVGLKDRVLPAIVGRVKAGAEAGAGAGAYSLPRSWDVKEGKGAMSISSHDVPIRSPVPRVRGEVLVDMKDINVKYGLRMVLKNINWQICRGERWHLQGSNGSGKTTLLSLLTGSHPQSYTQTNLHLFSLPRSKIPTPRLQALVGVLTPEIFDAFPRRAGVEGMSVWEAVGTGFDGVFWGGGKGGVGRGTGMEAGGAGIGEEEREWRIERVWEILEALGPESWYADNDKKTSSSLLRRTEKGKLENFKDRKFADLPTDEQRMVLTMRALVGRPGLVLLDEVWSGMGAEMGASLRRYLRGGGAATGLGVRDDQAVIVVTHWEEEVPWRVEEGVRRFVLEGGEGRAL